MANKVRIKYQRGGRRIGLCGATLDAQCRLCTELLRLEHYQYPELFSKHPDKIINIFLHPVRRTIKVMRLADDNATHFFFSHERTYPRNKQFVALVCRMRKRHCPLLIGERNTNPLRPIINTHEPHRKSIAYSTCGTLDEWLRNT